MSTTIVLPHESPWTPTTTFAVVRDTAIWLRLEWTKTAVWLVKKHSTHETGLATQKLAALLENAVVHILYYHTKAEWLRAMQYSHATMFERLRDVPYFMAGLPEGGYEDLLRRLEERTVDERIAMLEALTGDELKCFLQRIRDASDRLLGKLLYEVDARDAELEDVESVWKAICSTGAGDALNTEEKTHDVDDLLQNALSRIDEWNRGGRMAFNLIAGAFESGIDMPDHGCFGNQLEAIKLPTLKRIESTLKVMGAVWDVGYAVRTGHVMEMRQLTAALVDFEVLQRDWLLPTQEEIVRARAEMTQLGVKID